MYYKKLLGSILKFKQTVFSELIRQVNYNRILRIKLD